MTKRNKVRYKSQGNQFPSLLLTGKVTRREREQATVNDQEEDDFAEEDEIPQVAVKPLPIAEVQWQKGDVQVFLSTDSNAHPSSVGDFYSIGLSGYLKANVWDGKGWKPLSLEEFFPDRIHYFGKRDRPIDTFAMCCTVFEQMHGVEIVRTYREHYRIKTPGDDSNSG